MLNSLLGVGGGRCQKEEKEEEEGKTEEEEEEEGSCSADNAKERDRPLHFPFSLQLRKNYGGKQHRQHGTPVSSSCVGFGVCDGG